jgi:hypothetical protein
MSTANSPFSLEQQPEVFASDTTTSVAVHRAVLRGAAVQIARGLYTRNVDEPITSVVRRNWTAVAAHYVPGGVVVDRSAFEAKPSDDGSLFLDGGSDWGTNRTYSVQGLLIKPRSGPGPLPGDMPHMHGLSFSSRPRAWLDNMRPSRARQGVSRTLMPAELERELNRLVSIRGWDALQELRDQARGLAPNMGGDEELRVLDDLIGALQGTRDVVLSTSAGHAAQRGQAFEARRAELFGALQSALLVEHFPPRPEQPGSFPALSFIEAYFSNWIEGTEFDLEEAEEIVFERAIPEGRFTDAHDVLGTFDLVNDPTKRRELPGDADERIALLLSHHAAMLERRPEVRPGQFKERVNRAGATTFVHPDLVEGTLRVGFRHLEALPAGMARAIFSMFLISEVHPFTDGNGRIARVIMNAELSAHRQQRIVIPLVYRDNYLQSLRLLSRNGDPAALIRVLDVAQRYTASIPWQDLRAAEQALRDSNAFVTPDEANETGARLKLPPIAS